jgi:hypothetical protein
MKLKFKKIVPILLLFIFLCSITNFPVYSAEYAASGVGSHSDISYAIDEDTVSILTLESNSHIAISNGTFEVRLADTDENDNSTTILLNNKIEVWNIISDAQTSLNVEFIFDIPENWYLDSATDLLGTIYENIIMVYDEAGFIRGYLQNQITDVFGDNVEFAYDIIDGNIVSTNIESSYSELSYPLVSLSSAEIFSYTYSDFFSSTGTWMMNGSLRALELYPDFSLSAWTDNLGMGTAVNDAIAAQQSWLQVKDMHSSSSYWGNESGLENQYKCHSAFARTKTPWHIEPARADVGYAATVLAACNP